MVFKHFKLTSGDEIVCEVIDYEEESADAVIRKALRIEIVEDFEQNVRYYTFKPWLSFQDDVDEYISLNPTHIICEALPSETIMTHYYKALDDVVKYNTLKKNSKISMEELHDKMSELTEKEMEEFLERKYRELQEEVEYSYDSDSADDRSENVIVFRPKTIH